jgi:glycosyltransferase
MMNKAISLVTVVYNGSSTIASCLNSINNQSLLAESIAIDGGSTDNTLDIIREISPQTLILSEPDHGIYDAMNKGLKLATGDIVGILNADDFYADNLVLERVAKVFDDTEIDACYGDLVYVQELGCGTKMLDINGNERGSLIKTIQDDVFAQFTDHSPKIKIIRYWKSGLFTTNRLKWGWMPPHPTFFVRRRIYEQYGLFNLDLGSAADYELMLRFLLKHRIRVGYIPEVLVCMRDGGVSNASLSNRLRANRMDRKAWEVNGLRPYPWTLALKPIRKIPQWFSKPPNVV